MFWDSMMMMIMMMVFCRMVDQQTALSMKSNWYHCQRFSLLQISDTLRAEFERLPSLSSGFVQSLHYVTPRVLRWNIFQRVIQHFGQNYPKEILQVLPHLNFLVTLVTFVKIWYNSQQPLACEVLIWLLMPGERQCPSRCKYYVGSFFGMRLCSSKATEVWLK